MSIRGLSIDVNLGTGIVGKYLEISDIHVQLNPITHEGATTIKWSLYRRRSDALLGADPLRQYEHTCEVTIPPNCPNFDLLRQWAYDLIQFAYPDYADGTQFLD